MFKSIEFGSGLYYIVFHLDVNFWTTNNNDLAADALSHQQLDQKQRNMSKTMSY